MAGVCGVCGVCGEMGLPGEEEEEKVEGTMPGLLKFLLKLVGDCGCRSNDVDIESARAEWESRIFWYFDNTLLVFRLASAEEDARKLFSDVVCPSAKSFMKS